MGTSLYFRTFCMAACLYAGLEAVAAGRDYRALVEQWRQQREAALKADGGWLTVTGLFWLKEGVNTIGSDPADDVQLPDGSPPHLGILKLQGDTARFTAAIPGVTLDGKPVREAVLRPNGQADTLSSGPLQLLVLKRGNRYALRLRDNHSQLRKNFTRLNWYPVREEWKVTAQFVAFPSAAKLVFDTVIGEPEAMDSPGYATFERGGQTYRLQAVAQGKRLLFVLRDRTSGKTTYGASRFLYTDTPRNGTVVLDFNQAENPPCAFTPYATCPLPPPQNRLPLAIEAGELKYDGAGH